MIKYIIVLVIILLFNLSSKNNKNKVYEINEYIDLDNYNLYKNSIWKNTKLYEDILDGKIKVNYKIANYTNTNYDPNSNLDYYKTPWNGIETISNDFLGSHNDKIKIIYDKQNYNRNNNYDNYNDIYKNINDKNINDKNINDINYIYTMMQKRN